MTKAMNTHIKRWFNGRDCISETFIHVCTKYWCSQNMTTCVYGSGNVGIYIPACACVLPRRNLARHLWWKRCAVLPEEIRSTYQQSHRLSLDDHLYRENTSEIEIYIYCCEGGIDTSLALTCTLHALEYSECHLHISHLGFLFSYE